VLVGDLFAILTAILYGADINSVRPSGETPLIIAIVNKQYLAAQLLLSNGASPDVKFGPDAGTPLHFVASQNDAEGIALLISAGASKDVKDKNGQNPINLCHNPRDAISRAFLGFFPTRAVSDDESADSTGNRIQKKRIVVDENRQQQAQDRILSVFNEQQQNSTTSSHSGE